MGIGTKLPALQGDEHDGSDDRNKVERQIHEVADDGFGRELGKGSLKNFAELCNRVRSGIDLTFGGYEGGLVAGDEGLVGTVSIAFFRGWGIELTPSNVSSKASSIRKFLLRTLKMVELSLRTSRMVVTIASGPLKMVRTAA